MENGRLKGEMLQVFEEVQQWDPPVPGLRGMVPIGSMTIPAQVCVLLWSDTVGGMVFYRGHVCNQLIACTYGELTALLQYPVD